MANAKWAFLNKRLLLIALSHTITDLSQGALPILLPFFKNAFALSYTQVGLIVLTQNITSSVIQPLFGIITDRLSLPWLTPVSLVLAGLGTAATGLATSYPVLLMIVVVTGLGVAAFHPQAAKNAHAVSAIEARGQSMAVYSIGGNLGQACGSIFMSALIALPGTLANTLYFCLPALVLAVMLWRNLPGTAPQPRAGRPANKAADAKGPIPIMVIGILLTYILLRTSINTGLINYIPLYYADFLGGSPVYAGYLVSGYMLSGVAGTYVGCILGDKFGRKTVIMGSMLLSFPLLSLLKATTGLWTLALVSAIGFIYIASFSSTIVLAQEMMPGHEALAASLTTGFSIGLSGFSVTLLGFFADRFGVPSVFNVIAMIPIAAFAIAWFLPGRLFKPDIIVKPQPQN